MSRHDLNVYNEATGFMITSAGVNNGDYADIDSEDEAWLLALKDGVFLPFELAQDDAFVIRVLIDEPLSAQEEEEWVGRTSHNLRIPDGRLAVIGGGLEYLWGEEMDEYSVFLDVPPGDYLAELYTYFHSVNGDFCLDEASSGEPEPIGSYFRRTRPGEPFPLWLHNTCADDPEADPGHDEEWKKAKPDYATEQPSFVSFLLRLTPLTAIPKPSALEDGWISMGQGARKPDRCPKGMIAEHLEPGEEDDDDLVEIEDD